MSPISRETADQIAKAVLDRMCSVLRDAHDDGRLQAIAYSNNSFEKWLVCETYARIYNDWDALVPADLRESWDSWMEVPVPKQEVKRKHFDLFVGPLVIRH